MAIEQPKNWFENAGLLLATTAGASAPFVAAATGSGLSLNEAVFAAGMGSVAAVTNVIAGKLGNSLHDSWTQRQIDPKSLLANHDLHNLTANACKVAIADAADEFPNLTSDDRDRLRELAEAFESQWDVLGATPGFAEIISRLPKEDLKHWYHVAADADPSSRQPAKALNAELWEMLIRGIGRHSSCTPSDDLIAKLSHRLVTQLPYVVRELLKEDFASDGGGHAFAGYVIKMLSELLAAANSGQFERGVVIENVAALHLLVRGLKETVDSLIKDGKVDSDQDAYEAFAMQYELWNEIRNGMSVIEERLRAQDSKAIRNNADTMSMLEFIHDFDAESYERILARLDEFGCDLHQLTRSLTNKSQNVIRRPILEPIRVGATDVFVSRPELARLKRWMIPKTPKPTIVYVQGMPGVGKSYLVERFVDTFWKDRHADSGKVAWVVLRTSEGDCPGLESLLDLICHQFEIAEVQPASQLLAVQQLLGRQSGRLLVVENVDDEASANSIAELLHRLGKVNAIVTGRFCSFSTGDWKALELHPFDEVNGIRQIKKEIGLGRFREFDEEDLVDLVQKLGGLPLAIHLAAGHLQAGTTAQEFLTELRSSRLELELADGANPRNAQDRARAVLHSSFQMTIDAFCRAAGADFVDWHAGLASLGHAPLAGWGLSIATAYAGLNERECRRMLRLGCRLSLLSLSRRSNGQRVWRIHPLLAEFLSTCTTDTGYELRVNEWFLSRIGDVDPDPELPLLGWHEITVEYAALSQWLSEVDPSEAMAIVTAAVAFARSNGPFQGWIDLCERCLVVTDDDEKRSEILWVLANVAFQSGEYDLCVKKAKEKIAVDRKRRDDKGCAMSIGMIADVLYAKGEVDEALRVRQEEELPVFERLGDVGECAATMCKISDVFYEKGEIGETLRILQEEQLPVFEKLGDFRSRAATMSKIADVLHTKGEVDEALRIRREEQLLVYEKLGDIRSCAITMCQIADVLWQKGEVDEALRILKEEQLPVFEKLGDVRERAITMGQIADVLYEKGEVDEALRIRREEELPVYEKLGDIRARAATIGKIAKVLFHKGEVDESLRMRREEELPVFETLGDVRECAVTKGKIADVLYAKGEVDESLRIRREEELPVYEKLGDIRSYAGTKGKIAEALYHKGEVDKSLRIRREEELPVYEKLGDIRARAATIGKIAKVLFHKGEVDESLRMRREEELPVYEKLGDLSSCAHTKDQIAEVLWRKGEVDEALRLLQQEVLPVFKQLGAVRSRAAATSVIAAIHYQKGEVDEALRTWRDDVLPAYEQLGDIRACAATMGKIASVLFHKGEVDEAFRIRREEQLPVFEKLGDVRSRAVTMSEIADLLYQNGEVDEALRTWREEVLPIFRQLGDVGSCAETMGCIASVLFHKGEVDEALRIRREEQLPVFEKLGYVRERAMATGEIARVLYRKGEVDKALRIRQEEELPVYEKLGDVHSRAATMDQIASLLYDKGEVDEALRIWREEVLPIYEQLGDTRSRAVTMSRIADVLCRNGELDEALGILQEEQLPVFDKLGDVRSRAATMGQIAQVLYEKGEFDESLRIRREEELPVYEQLGDIRLCATTMCRMSEVLYVMGEADEARRIQREEVLPIHEQLGDVRSRAATMSETADLLYKNGNLDESLRIRREEVLPIYEQLGDVHSRAITMSEIARVLCQNGELDQALSILQEEQLPVFERLGDVRSRAFTLGQIAKVLSRKGEVEEAFRIRQEEELPVYEQLGDVREQIICRVELALMLRSDPSKSDEVRAQLEWALAESLRIGIPEAATIRSLLSEC